MNSYFFRRFSVPDDSRENETGGGNRMTDVQGESILRGHEERCRELIAGLTVMDDILMRNVLNQTECTEYVPQTN